MRGWIERHLRNWSVLATLVIAPGPLSSAPTPAGDDGSKSRSFNFTYAATIHGLAPGQSARVWLPVPSSSEEQQVEMVSRSMPAEPRIGSEASNGNQVLYFEAGAAADGMISLQITYLVTRREVGESSTAGSGEPNDKYLLPDRLVPIGGKPMSLLRGKSLPADQLQLAHLLYDVVDDHLQYRKDKPGWGRGDAVWACDSGFGNCTDFHSLFISLARSEHLPAKFEIGFAIPEKTGSGQVTGYHCWATVRPAGHGWIPVDISEANQDPSKRDYCFGHLSDDRVAFSTGRDLVLTPKQDGPSLNFFIFPYVEVDRKPLPATQVQMRCTYSDLPSGLVTKE